MNATPGFFIQAAYFAAAVMFIYGLKAMSSPVTARRGILWAGAAMLVAIVVTFFHPQVTGNYLLMLIAIAIGSGATWWTARRVAMTEDRKSTRLNSSHVAISYAVFCLKKKIGNEGGGVVVHGAPHRRPRHLCPVAGRERPVTSRGAAGADLPRRVRGHDDAGRAGRVRL